MKNPPIVLAGGTGFLGRILSRHLAHCGHSVIVLTRTPSGRSTLISELPWDGRTVGPWAECLEGAQAVVNLAGRSVNCRYHSRNRRAIRSSRIDSTRVLGEAIRRCAKPPPVWLNSSTATIYQHSLHRPMDETSGNIAATEEAKDAFSIEVARAWEETLEIAPTPGTRKVAMRTAMVLGWENGGVFRVLRRLVLMGLGGRMASGKQFVSWIHAFDFCRAINWLITSSELEGPVNLSAPNPIPNCELMWAVRQACHRRAGLPATRWMLEAGAFFLRTETELILKSRRVMPARLLASGFEFRFPELRPALADLCAKLSTQ